MPSAFPSALKSNRQYFQYCSASSQIRDDVIFRVEMGGDSQVRENLVTEEKPDSSNSPPTLSGKNLLTLDTSTNVFYCQASGVSLEAHLLWQCSPLLFLFAVVPYLHTLPQPTACAWSLPLPLQLCAVNHLVPLVLRKPPCGHTQKWLQLRLNPAPLYQWWCSMARNQKPLFTISLY